MFKGNHARKLSALSGGASVIALLVAAPALAQTAKVPETIVVTATKRATSIQDVPFSINAQTQEDIQRTGATNIEELSRNVAGLIVQNLGPGQSQVAIRGVSAGQIVRDQPGVKEQVGVYLDESVVSLSLFTPDLDLYDLNRVETLRGPQNTLFGSGSVGGTIRYITNQPNLSKYEGSLEGNLNSLTEGGTGGGLKGMVNLPLGKDQAALRIVGYYTDYAGFIDALREGSGTQKDVNSGKRKGVRVSVTRQSGDNLTITPRVVYQETTSDGFNREEVFNLFANPFTITRPPVTFDERQQFLLLNEEFSDKTTLADLTVGANIWGSDFTSVTSFLDRDILVSRDASALTGSVSVDLGFPDAAVLLPSNLRDTTGLKQFTQEVRLSSAGKDRFQWLLGAFYSRVKRNYAQRLPTPGYMAALDAKEGAGTSASKANGFADLNSPYSADLPYDIRQTAFFGEASYDLNPRLTATFGGRYFDFEEDRRFHSGGRFSGRDNRTDSTASTGFTPRGILSFEVNDNWRLNMQAAKGFRLGGVNDPLNLPICDGGVPGGPDATIFGGYQSYKDETSWNYEAGVKFSRSNVSFSAATFRNEITNLQVTLDAGSCSSRISFNVPKAHTSGVEFEFAAATVDGLEVSVAGSLVEAEFDSTVRDGTGAVIGGIAAGNRLASVPKFQIAATATYYFGLESWQTGMEGFLGMSIQNIGDRFTQPSDQVPGRAAVIGVSHLPFGGATGNGLTPLELDLDPYTLVNVNTGVQTHNWSLRFYINNLADVNAHLAFDRERGGRARLGFHTNQPRTYGVTLNRSF
jgi:iron complex outermembrane receptor protein